jgi:lysozyme
VTPSRRLRAFLERIEGKRFLAYPDSKGIWTIGIGHTGGEVCQGLIWSEALISAAYERDVEEAARIVMLGVHVPLSQNMFDALCSFVFNVGSGHAGRKDGFLELKSGRPSTLLTLINDRAYWRAGDEFRKWANQTVGEQLVVVGGLFTRRQQERALFLEGIDEWLESQG